MSDLEYKRYRCLDPTCGHVFSGEEALKEDVVLRHGGPAVRWSCPDCGSYKFEAFTACVECLQRPAMPGLDECRECDLLTADALVDMQLEAIEERRPKSELSLLCAEIALSSWRRSA